jgi:chromosome segregation and condensation protein ScpB
MNVTVEIPDDLAVRLTAGGRDLSRQALEMIAADAYKQDRITKPELQRLLGIETSYQLDGFLKAHGIWIEYTLEDAAREQRSLDRLGL